MSTTFRRLLGTISIFLFALTFEAEAQGSILAIMSLSGETAPAGNSCREAFQIGAEYFGIPKESIIFGDHRDSPRDAVLELQKRISEARAVFSTRSPIISALNPLLSSHEIPFVGLSVVSQFTDENKNYVQLFPDGIVLGNAAAESFRSRSMKKILNLVTEDEYNLEIQKGFMPDGYIKTTRIMPSERDFKFLSNEAKNFSGIFLNIGYSQFSVALKALESSHYGGFILSNGWVTQEGALQGVSDEVKKRIHVVDVDFSNKMYRELWKKSPTSISFYCLLGPGVVLSTLEHRDVVKLGDDDFLIKDRKVQFRVNEQKVEQ